MNERVGCSSVTSRMKDFIMFLEDMDLIDVHMTGAQFTWKNKSKLDRFVISSDFDDHYPQLQRKLVADLFLITRQSI